MALWLTGCAVVPSVPSVATPTSTSTPTATAASAPPPLPAPAPAPAPAPPALVFQRPVVLLGEVHDHPRQHALRAAAFRAHVQAGARPALALEQFDREHQAAIDAAPRRADAVIAAGRGGPGWNWDFYRPFIETALRHGLPIVAANVGRDEARRVMRDGLAATGFVADVPPDIGAALTRAIVDGHCGLLDEATAGRMALAQIARDQQMARVLRAHAARGVVLLAGNGHVRTDVGVPRWLDAATRARTEAIGWLEEGDPAGAFDRRVFTPPHPRPDPCEALRRPAPAAPPSIDTAPAPASAPAPALLRAP